MSYGPRNRRTRRDANLNKRWAQLRATELAFANLRPDQIAYIEHVRRSRRITLADAVRLAERNRP